MSCHSADVPMQHDAALRSIINSRSDTLTIQIGFNTSITLAKFLQCSFIRLVGAASIPLRRITPCPGTASSRVLSHLVEGILSRGEGSHKCVCL
mmetsp:Transcript_13365/g.35775  ORF Transcript_13365/g.35775 Transcript_13365/m.35775 type:complete len:94 (-) Transcript_13365:65-346(-)